MIRTQQTPFKAKHIQFGQQTVDARRGAVTIETAIILNVFLLLILGTFDLGIATYRYNPLPQAARQRARQAITHGSFAPPATTAWGPNTYAGTADDGSGYAQAVSPTLVRFTLNNIIIKVEWLHGGNDVQQRVRYTVTTNYRPFTSLFSSSTYTQTAASTMSIAN